MMIELKDERVRVLARFEERGSIRAGTKVGRCLGFEIELSLQSDEPLAQLTGLLRQAHNMCFTEDVLAHEVDLKIEHIVNGKAVSLA